MDTSFSSVSSWRPALVESTDGAPLVSSISEFFVNFPFDRLPQDEASWLSFFLRPDTVVLSVLFYLASEPLLKALVKRFGLTGRSNLFRGTVALHNLSLAIFSYIVFVNAWDVSKTHLLKRGLEATYCDREGTLWTSGLGAWSTIFYISKFYEFLDTWILVIKGKKASFLQIYHHAGIVLSMWGGILTQSAWLAIVVVLNSFIHTLMYTYFFIKTISPQQEIKAARYLTTAQITQFFTGIFVSLYIHVMGDQCATSASRFVLALLQLYGVGLILLFTAFAAKKYKKV